MTDHMRPPSSVGVSDGGRAAEEPAYPLPCPHEDDFGSTIIFIRERPQDGVCMLCDEYFPDISA